MTGAQPVPRFMLKRLAWADADLGTIDFPAGPMRLRTSFGSGLATRRGDPPGLVWAVGDRGPNIKVKALVKRYGVEQLRPFATLAGAKVMPRPDVGPAIACLRIGEDRVDLVATLALVGGDGAPVMGLPIPGGEHARREPALDLAGNALAPHAAGFDTEGIVALREGGFWVGDEFGPSLVEIDDVGRIVSRVLPEGVSLEDAPYPVRAALPAIAARRHINRGFEALALSGDERWLFLAFQSPLAHPDVAAHEQARHVRFWKLERSTLRIAGQYLYPLDPLECFVRDNRLGELGPGDLKIGEMAWIAADTLLVLERGSASTRIHRVALNEDRCIDQAHLDESIRPTIEEMSASGALDLPVLAKRLVFDSDLAPEIPSDLEGMAVLSPTELLLVNDNDFGVEGAETQFWKVTFAEPVLA